MLRKILTASFVALVASHLYGQTSNEFEVATIKPAPPQSGPRTHTRISTDTGTGKLTYANVNLKEAIGQAYKVQQYQISGPDWLEADRFDIVARFPPRSEAEKVPLMLQALLADRFKLNLHRETKELPVYSLTVARNGPKFKKSETASGITTNSSRTEWHVVAKVSMERFAEFLTSEAGRLVLDKTGLPGSYEVTLDWAPDGAPTGTDGVALPSLFTALQEQLGLKLVSTKAPVETLVIDHVDRTPAEN
jgi:uncharacterized protein (TIGR03435 family)